MSHMETDIFNKVDSVIGITVSRLGLTSRIKCVSFFLGGDDGGFGEFETRCTWGNKKQGPKILADTMTIY